MVKLLKLIKQDFFYWSIVFLLFFIPAYPKFPLVAIPKTYVSIRVEDFLVAFVLGFFLLKIFRKKQLEIDKQILRLIFIYFAVGFLSVLNGIFITKNIVPHLAFLHFLRRVEYISLFFIAYFSFKNFRQIKVFGISIAAALVIVIIYGLGQKFFGWPVVSTMNEDFARGLVLKLTWWARINSTFAGHYDLAAYMVMVLPLIIAISFFIKRLFWKILIIVLGIFCYYILILTASRVSFLAFLCGSCLVFLLANKKILIIPFLIFSLLGMFFSEDLGQRYASTFNINLNFLSGKVKVKEEQITAVLTVTPTPTPVIVESPTPPVYISKITPQPTIFPSPTPVSATPPVELFEPVQLAVSRSTDIRLKKEWPRAINAFLKNPLLGTGYSSITLATDNDYLRMLGETGILGFLSFLIIIFYLLLKMTEFLQKSVDFESKILITGVFGAVTGYFLNALFIDVFEASKLAFFFWIMMGVVFKVIDLNNKQINK